MSANLFGERFVGVKTAAWHNLGTVVDSASSVSEAVQLARLNYDVVKLPSYAVYEDPSQGITETFPTGRFSLMRKPTVDDNQWRFFGEVSSQYEVVNNEQLATILDPLAEEWPVETAGALGNGESVFFTLKVRRSVEIKDDELDLYFLVNDVKDGKSALRIAFTPIRVVCQNTLISGLSQASVNASLTHIDTAKSLQWRVDLLKSMNKAMDTTIDTFRQLASYILTESSIEAVLKAAYPAPGKPGKVNMVEELGDEAQELLGNHFEGFQQVNEQWAYYCKQAEIRRSESKTRLERFNDEFPGAANSGWAVYNAVVENEDWRTGPASMFESAVFGERAKPKKRAMAAIVSQMK